MTLWLNTTIHTEQYQYRDNIKRSWYKYNC